MSVTSSKVAALVNALTAKFAAINHTHSGYVSGSKVTSWSGTPSDNNVASEKLIKDSLDDKIEASNISFGFDANTKEIYIELK